MRRHCGTCQSGFLVAAAIGAGSLLGGCLSPAKNVEPRADDPSALKAIRARFEQIVEAAHNDPHTQWHSSWTGNVFVNSLKGRHRGLCYQWQDYVYRGISPTVERSGWACTGLVTNEGNTLEHHVVLVWDPRLLSESQILAMKPPRPVYVLDAWYEGKANVHWLDDWLENEKPLRSPTRLQQLPEQYEDPSNPVQFSIPEPNAGSR